MQPEGLKANVSSHARCRKEGYHRGVSLWGQGETLCIGKGKHQKGAMFLNHARVLFEQIKESGDANEAFGVVFTPS
jgi:hypothetical protein